MFDGHFAGCATLNMDRELERRRQVREADEQAQIQRRLQEQASRDIPMTASEIARINSETRDRLNAMMQMPNDFIERLINPPVMMPAVVGFGEMPYDMRPGAIVRRAGELGVPEAPRTSAEMPSERARGRHEVTRVSEWAAKLSGVEISCSCGWEVTGAWLLDVAEIDIRGMIEAHQAGGDVGPKVVPKKQHTRADCACYNCERKPAPTMLPLEVLAMTCCDGEMQLKPRRHFKLELEQ